MRSIFIAFAALIAATQAVSLQNLRKSHVREFARAQSAKRQIESSTKLFAQQSFDLKIPKGELTQADKDKIYNDFGFGLIDADGNHRISFEEALSQLPAEWRSPEFDEQMKR